MINFYNQVPTVYTSASRDFQYLSWLINIVLNSVKHNVDDMYRLPHVGYDPKLSELLALTLGFKIKRNYDQKQLAALVEILPSVLKYKGTLKAVKIAAEALITASGSLGDTDYRVDNAHLEVVLPEDLSIDITLFIDLLDYILPAGMTYRVVRKNQTKRTLTTEARYHDIIHYDVIEDLAWENTDLSSGLSTLFDIDSNNAQSAQELAAGLANIKKSDNGYTVNTGLLDNTIIPILSGDKIASDNAVTLLSTEQDGSHEVLFTDTANAVLLKAKKGI